MIRWIWWRGLDSNQRRCSPTDLQSVPFSHSGTPPRRQGALWPNRGRCQRSWAAATRTPTLAQPLAGETSMLASQRALFDIPDHVCYLNAAAYGPLPRAVKAAGEIGVARKAQPWAIEPGNAETQIERARTAAARLTNA